MNKHTVYIAPPDGPASFVFSRSDFVARFTDAELENIVDSNAKAIKTFVVRLQLADEVNTGSPVVVAALEKLELVGMIGPGRADAILGRV